MMVQKIFQVLSMSLIFLAYADGATYTFQIEGQIDYTTSPIPDFASEIIIYSADNTYQSTISTASDGSFKYQVELNDTLKLTFLVTTIDPCSGEIVSAKVESHPGTSYVNLPVCVLDDFPCSAAFDWASRDELTLEFRAITHTDSADYHWNFGDGTSGSGPFTTHHYDSAGSYIVTLSVSSTDSCQDSVMLDVIVGPRDCICPLYYQPVCAIRPDGQIDTFSNPCFAACAGYVGTLISCESSCDCPPVSDPVCILTEGGMVVFENNCFAACAGYDTLSVCDTTCICPEIYAPVCVVSASGDTITFANECFAICAGYKDFTLCDPACFCEKIYAPVCVESADGAFLTFTNACLAACAGYEVYSFCGDTISGCACPAVYDPVCVLAKDGSYLQFANACYARCEGYDVTEKCDSTLGCICPEYYDPVCVISSEGDTILFDNACKARCAGYEKFEPCRLPCSCEKIYDPVCVFTPDGEVIYFDNSCLAACAGYLEYFSCKDSTQSCICPQIYAPVCVVTDANDTLTFSNDCYATCAGYDTWMACEPHDCVCDAVYDPVCIVLEDGTFKEFENTCRARCAGYEEVTSCEKDEATVSNPLIHPGSQRRFPPSAIKIFPNPFSEQFQLATTLEKGLYYVSLYNVLGQCVSKTTLKVGQNNWSYTIPTTEMSPGYYLIEITDDTGRREAFTSVKR